MTWEEQNENRNRRKKEALPNQRTIVFSFVSSKLGKFFAFPHLWIYEFRSTKL
jgi:hypothetical protein